MLDRDGVSSTTNRVRPDGESVTRLLSVAADQAMQQNSIVDSASAVLLGHDAVDKEFAGPAGSLHLGGVSGLNNDGSPLQLCISSTATGKSVRLIADPAWFIGESAQRLRLSRRALNDAMIKFNAERLIPIATDLIDRVTQQDSSLSVDRFQRGMMWVGAGLNDNGIAVYLDIQPHGPKVAWSIVEQWMVSVLPESQECRAVFARLREFAEPASVGFEGSAPESSRLKIYWRLSKAINLSDIGIDALSDPIVAQFLSVVVSGNTMNLSGAVFCIGFNTSTGSIKDAKVDLCAHCLPYDNAQWVSIITQLCQRFELQPYNVSAELLALKCEVGFIGLGVNNSREDTGARLNLYLRPTREFSLQKNQPMAERVRASIKQASNFLLDLQNQDGSWHDYQLPVGSSTQWVTAFVAHALTISAKKCGTEAGLQGARRAATFLLEQQHYSSGWGYNHTTGVDADSTGWTLRLLKALDIPFRTGDEACLFDHWHKMGGFSTYHEANFWAAPHPCVSVACFTGLSEVHQQELIPTLKKHLDEFLQEDGTLPSYWWRTHHYSTYHYLKLLTTLGIRSEFSEVGLETLSDHGSSSAFESAYQLGIIKLCQGDIDGSLSNLLEQQRFDGGWLGSTELRVTEDTCQQPWLTPQGRLYRDVYGTISTASALLVLSDLMEGENNDW
jgi:hypothetical protein